MALFRIGAALPLSSSADGTMWQTVTAHRRRGSCRWIVLERGLDQRAVLARLDMWLVTRRPGQRGQYFFGELAAGLSAADVDRELARVDFVDGVMSYDGHPLVAEDDDG